MKAILFSLLLLSGSLCAVSGQPLPDKQKTVKSELGANDPIAHSYLQKTQRWIKSCKSLEIRFVSFLTDAQHLNAGASGSRGSLLIQQQQFRLISGSEEYYCDGSTLWAYSPELKEVSIYAYQESMQSINPIQQLREYDRYFRAKYIRQQNVAGMNRHIIDLIPIESSEVMKIRLYLNPNDPKIHKMEIYLPQNQVYVYNELQYAENPEVSPEDFRFDTKKFPQVMVNDMR